ncbi:Hypothetical protein AJAP_42655 (plasmid) [Amycolatopsis japonica]|uniref:Uncharacterized protein n=1 Tax=Amycolatopsis japonica TaxID=208439 RepID=A0A075V758_9PSEU|nr:hypothetical protein [Amycolatopsis japonica]AIG81298.1 Hypothetical protein AJAP_42655 [Amycolatopsis japonica]
MTSSQQARNDPNRLPTWDHMMGKALEELTGARGRLGDARDQLNSDWRPPGPYSVDAGHDRVAVLKKITALKTGIDEVKRDLYAMMDRENEARPAKKSSETHDDR